MTADYTLSHGTHATPEEGRCAMEWVSYLAGEEHSDSPACVSPVLRALCIALNDGLPPGPRQRLRPYLTRTIGTAGDGLDEQRAWLAMDWLIRTYAPRWLSIVSLDEEAERLASGPAITGPEPLRTAMEPLEQARAAARRSRAAAFANVGNPVTSWAAQVTLGRTGREAAWACAGAAVWAAARLGIGEQDGDRARAGARSLAGDAAAVAVRRLRDDDVCGRLAGREGLRTALGPTLQSLADSSIELLDRMLPTEALGWPDPPTAPWEAPVLGAAAV
ncbi:MAG TPA: hypothetical protein VMF07_00110 [Solirubrobacteraceae bacterium]|nr:hypothetical protein [Solirubrobacteraceae bacterium]